MINEAKDYIRKVLTPSTSLLCSFGKESMVLLTLARQVKPDFSVIWFGDSLPELAKSMLLNDSSFGVVNYPPADRYFIRNGDGYSLIDEYSLAQTRVPMISDVVEGACELKFPMKTLPTMLYSADVTLWGYRSEDNHSIINTTFQQRFQLGTTVMDAPLYDWSEQDVYRALDYLGVPYEPETNRVSVCEDCLREIDATVGNDSLRSFQERFGFGGH